ncbi:MAG: MBL fold metallo-hydrolase [Verrucomicrobiae bacterium]|nr:MBL fold metallo-hydrolase [Verrucomicrobiae bacterium]
MQLELYCGGPVETNGYWLRKGKTVLLIDAPMGMLQWAKARQAREPGLKWGGLLITHGHWDHIGDALGFQQLGMPVYAHRDGALLIEKPEIQNPFNPFCELQPCRPDGELKGKTSLKFGELEVRLLECPGHCPGSVCFYVPDEKIVFTGDVLFAGAVGRWDLPGGSREVLMGSIGKNLIVLPGETRILAGHGPETTILREKQANPFAGEAARA